MHLSFLWLSECLPTPLIAIMQARELDKATETLKGFVKTDDALVARAAINLSFVYHLEGDVASAEKYAKLAVDTEKYNARALVNLGNTLFARGEFDKAAAMYADALAAEADCTEALYNQVRSRCVSVRDMHYLLNIF